MLFKASNFDVNSDSDKASLPNKLFLWLRMSFKSAVEFLLCPDGNITNSESNFSPFLRVTIILDGIPSGYFSSYAFPPC